MVNMQKNIYLIYFIALYILLSLPLLAQSPGSAVKLARVKYSGGGDWYNDPSGEINLLNYVNKVSNIECFPKYEYVDLATDKIGRAHV
mgnify:FL=1